MGVTAVLVHGAWHGGWCFDRVVPLLDATGVDSVAVDLPGHGDDPGPFSDLHGDAARVRAVVDSIDGDVVLLGHSYGGAVITEAGTHPAVSHLVYLASFPLDDGESCMACAVTESERAQISIDGPTLADAFVSHPDGTATITAEGAATCFFHDCDPGTVRWAVERLGPQPMATLGDTPTAVAWRERPSTYVVCSDDQAVDPRLQRIVGRRCGSVLEWPTSHSPFLSRPELVADLIRGLATP